MRHEQLMKVLTAGVVAALLVAACGDDGDGDGGDAATTTEAASDGPSTTAGDPEPANGFDGSTIRLGVLVPLTGLPSLIGSPLAAGQEAYWAYVNEELGGIAGRYPVEVVIEDTLYETNTTVQQYNRIKDEVVLFAQVMGTPHNLALLPLLQDDNIVVAPASQDAFWIREQQMLPIIEPYQIDVINAFDYYVTDGGGSVEDTVCGVLENDTYGEAGQQGLEFAAAELGFEVATITRYELGDTEFTAQITALKNGDCDVVLATALPSEFRGLVSAADSLGFTPRWIGQSPAWVDELATTDLLPYLEEHVWIVATGPEWGDESHPGVTALMDRLERYRPDQEPDYYFSFGYYQATAVHQVLERAVERGDLSREGIVEAMNSLEVLDFGGVIGEYTFGPPEERDPSRQSTMFRINADKPFALEAMEVNFTSDAAQAFEIEG